jgi:hypothetical protein
VHIFRSCVSHASSRRRTSLNDPPIGHILTGGSPWIQRLSSHCRGRAATKGTPPGASEHAQDAGAPALAALTAARAHVDQPLSPDAPQDLADLEAATESDGYGHHGQAPTRVLADLVTDFTTLRPPLTVPQPDGRPGW